MIYHITYQVDWSSALDAGVYTANSLASQGFIHCSTREQVLPVAERCYAGQTGLVLLCIDEEKLIAPASCETWRAVKSFSRTCTARSTWTPSYRPWLFLLARMVSFHCR